MAQTIKRPFRTFNGVDWDTHHFQTSADQVKTNSGTTVESELAQIKTDKADKSELNLKVNKNDYIANNAFARTSGTATAYTASLNPAPTAYVDGLAITIVPNVDCGINPTLNINGLGALPLLKSDSTNFTTGELKASKPYSFVRVGSNFFIRSSSSGGMNKGEKIAGTNVKSNVGKDWHENYGLGNIGNITTDEDRNIYFSTNRKTLYKYSPSNQKLWEYPHTNSISHLYLRGDIVYFIDDLKNLYRLSKQGALISTKAVPYPSKITYFYVTENGEYLVGGEARTIVKYNSDLVTIWTSFQHSANITKFFVTENGTIFSSSYYKGNVYKINSGGSRIWEYIPPLNDPSGNTCFDVDSMGQVHMNHKHANEYGEWQNYVTVVSPNGTFVSDFYIGFHVYALLCGNSNGTYIVVEEGQLIKLLDNKTILFNMDFTNKYNSRIHLDKNTGEFYGASYESVNKFTETYELI